MSGQVGVLLIQFVDPASDFSDGLKVLHAYHDSFLLHGRQLLELAQTLCKQGLNEARASEAGHLANYYNKTTRFHHRDEEHCLFPLIVNQSFLIDGMIERLALDHEELEELGAELVEELQAPERMANPARCLELSQKFERRVREHLERENLDFFPEIKKLLSLDQLAEMGKRMARLRSRG